jgi:hypothetical protein
MLKTQEHYDLMAQFERQNKGLRFDREDRSVWHLQRLYQSGETNTLFLMFRQGYALGKVAGR